MKRNTLIAALLTAFMAFGGVSLYARGWGHHGGWGGHQGYGMGYHHMEVLSDELKLTEKQVEKIIQIDADYRVKFYQNRDNNDKIITLREEHRKAVYNVLTDEQKKKYDANFNGRRGFGFCRNW
ncbi:MAG TPA: hypothetical protein PLY21_18995 [Spirochaetota bacterium]|nr:hypothetical protein [Spirochaetota bacterium]